MSQYAGQFAFTLELFGASTGISCSISHSLELMLKALSEDLQCFLRPLKSLLVWALGTWVIKKMKVATDVYVTKYENKYGFWDSASLSHIFRCKCLKGKPKFKEIESKILPLIKKSELYYGKMKSKIKKHLIKWAPYSHTSLAGERETDVRYFNEYM